jgi:DNA polymerase I
VQATVLAELNSRLTASAAEIAQQAYAEIGREVNLGSPKQLQDVLFTELNMPKTRANKTGYSTDAQALADLQEQHPHPFLELLLKHRDATKIKQIIETLERGIGPDGRVHTSYEQTGSATGRVSSNDPNLQNIPIKSEIGREVRSAFTMGEGFGRRRSDRGVQLGGGPAPVRRCAHLPGRPR